MSNAELVRYLADGLTLQQISIKKEINIRAIHVKIIAIKEITGCDTLAAIVANYLRKKIIE